MYAVICVLNVYYTCVLHFNCICAVGYAFLGVCNLQAVKRKARVLEDFHQTQELFIKGLNILLFCSDSDPNLPSGEILFT